MADLSAYDQVFEDAGREWNVDPTLLKAVAAQESGGNPRAVSRAGAQGLMQIIPSTQKALGITDPNDPVQSIFGAAKYLSEGLDKEGSPEGALLFYHGGPGWRQAYGQESAAYVPAVTARYRALAGSQAAIGQNATQPAPAASDGSQDGSAPLAVGDSLAVGMGGRGVVGASPEAVRDAITGTSKQPGISPDTVKGHDIVLSSGASNNPAQIPLVEQQINALQGMSPRSITLVGVGDRPDLTRAGVNPALASIAARTGVRFVPLSPAQLGPDHIHPTRAGYNALLASAATKVGSY
jgi:hypothetical protein